MLRSNNEPSAQVRLRCWAAGGMIAMLLSACGGQSQLPNTSRNQGEVRLINACRNNSNPPVLVDCPLQAGDVLKGMDITIAFRKSPDLRLLNTDDAITLVSLLAKERWERYEGPQLYSMPSVLFSPIDIGGTVSVGLLLDVEKPGVEVRRGKDTWFCPSPSLAWRLFVIADEAPKR